RPTGRARCRRGPCRVPPARAGTRPRAGAAARTPSRAPRRRSAAAGPGARAPGRGAGRRRAPRGGRRPGAGARAARPRAAAGRWWLASRPCATLWRFIVPDGSCAVTVVGARRRADLALPTGVAVADLMPELVTLLEEHPNGGTPRSWSLLRLGGATLDAE